MAKIVVAASDINTLRPFVSALGHDIVTSISIPQGNRYEPHQGSKEKQRRLKRLAKGEGK